MAFLRIPTTSRITLALILGMLIVVAGHSLADSQYYLLFHSVIEIFCVVVAFSVFVIAWNTHTYQRNVFLTWLGVAWLFVGMLDLAHALSYRGMGVFPQMGANIPTQLWIASRALESLSFVTALLVSGATQIRWSRVITGYAVVTFLLIAAIGAGIFPDCYLDGRGLTLFKIVAEYVIGVIILVALCLFVRCRHCADPAVKTLMVSAMLVTIVSELMFTQYFGVYDVANFIGHAAKFVAFLLMYCATIEIGLRQPYRLMFYQNEQQHSLLQQERNLFANVLDRAGGLLLVLDAQGRIVRLNHACETLLGVTRDEVLGQEMWSLYSDQERLQYAQGVFANVKAGHSPQYHETAWIRRSGERRDLVWVMTALDDANGELSHVIVSGFDITAMKETESRLHRQAQVDPLTGLYNRWGLMHLWEQHVQVAKRLRHRLVVHFFDVNHMKEINDRHGHLAGDIALRATAGILKDVFRSSDIVARFGGDEFVVIAMEEQAYNETALRERIQRRLEYYNAQRTHTFALSCSMGIAYCDPETVTTIDEILEAADQAMYVEKRKQHVQVGV